MNHPRRQQRWLSRLDRPPGRPSGFSLIEVLVGTAITVTVVTSMAAMALLSELRLGRDAEVNQTLVDHWSRTLTFISNEAQQAHWIRTSLRGTYPSTCGKAAPDGGGGALLVLEGPPSEANPTEPLWQVVYGVRENTNSKDWRGVNRLVRCGPPFEAISRWAQAEADAKNRDQLLEADASFGALSDASPTETVIADQLAQDNPLQVQLFEPTQGRDRDALLSLFFARKSDPAATYPPPKEFSTYQTRIRANRNPGFDVTATTCQTSKDSDGNQEPADATDCRIAVASTTGQLNTYYKEYRLPASAGTFVVNQCSLGANCVGPKSIGNVDVIYLSGSYDSYTTKQFSQSNEGPCSRTSCYLANKEQKVQIYDGDILVFNDRIRRL